MKTPNTRNPWILPLGPIAVTAPDGSITLQGLLPVDVAIPTDAGTAAGSYLSARSSYWEAVSESAHNTTDGCPNLNTPEVIAAGIVMEVTAFACLDAGEYVCPDCGLLEQCCCPDGAPW